MSYTLDQMFDLMDIEASDIDGNAYPNRLKIAWLNRAQDHIVSMINSQYLVGLHTVDAGKTLTTGTFALSGLTYSVFRKHIGFMGVKSADTSGIFCEPMDFEQYKQLVSDAYTFVVTKPAYMVRGSTLYVFPTSIATADIYYMREPVAMSESVASGSISSGKVYTVVEDPYINGTTYAVTYNAVAKYDGQTFTGTSTTTYTTSGTGVVALGCELDGDVQEPILTYAISFALAHNGENEKAAAKQAKAYELVQIINAKIDPENAGVRTIERTAAVAYKNDRLTNLGGR